MFKQAREHTTKRVSKHANKKKHMQANYTHIYIHTQSREKYKKEESP